MRTFNLPLTFVSFIVALCGLQTPAFASEVGWRELAEHPERFIGQTVELGPVYCGNNGDKPGYMCSTAGSLFVNPKMLATGLSKNKIDKNCGGLDWIEKSAFCRVKLRFIPTGFHTSTELEKPRTVIVIESDVATPSF